MDDILLILLGIIWAVFSLYQSQQKKKKKAARQNVSGKKAQNQSPYSNNTEDTSDDQEEGFLDKVFNTLDSQHNDSYQSFAETPTVEDADWAEEQAVDSGEKEKTIQEQSREKKEKKKESSFTYRKHRTNKKKRLVREISKDFDGKKAVIYSEIINRKYT